METAPSPLLDDLALIYFTLAHGADEQLDDAEVDKMADLLREWQVQSPRTSVFRAVKEALAVYERDDALDRVNEAVDRVRDHVSAEERQLIMDDLLELALADGRFLHEESAFIGELAETWGVEMSAPGGWAGDAWSMLQERGPREQWTALHDLALIYLTLAYETDQHLDAEEVNAITARISEWVPGATEPDILAVVREVLETYVQGPEERVFAAAVSAVGDAVPDRQHAALLEDLRSIALADGQLLDTERTLIEQLVDAWHIESETYERKT